MDSTPSVSPAEWKISWPVNDLADETHDDSSRVYVKLSGSNQRHNNILTLHQFFEPLPNQAEETDDKPTPDPPTQEGDESQGPADNTERKVQEGPTQQ